MGNKKFKLSNMIPNAWFYKLIDMGKNNTYKTKKSQTTSSSSSSSSLSNSSSLFSSSNSNSIPPKTKQPQISQHRQSYYFTRDLSSPYLQSPNSETKLSNSPIQYINKKRIRTRASFEKLLNSQTPVSLGSEKVLSNSNLKSCDTNSGSFVPVLENKSENSPNRSSESKIRNKGNKALSGKPNSFIPVLSDAENSFSNTNLEPIQNKFDGFDPKFKKESQSSLISYPKQRIRNRALCDKPNSQKPISPETEKRILKVNLKLSDTNADGFHQNLKSELPPIITKKKTEGKKEKKTSGPRKQRNTTGLKIRSNSPRIGKIDESGRKSFSSCRRRRKLESFAVVKSSSDPQEDFRESMVEMILQNNINGSKELEDLLACYLELNCDEYHEMIIKVFKQIWLNLARVRV